MISVTPFRHLGKLSEYWHSLIGRFTKETLFAVAPHAESICRLIALAVTIEEQTIYIVRPREARVT